MAMEAPALTGAWVLGGGHSWDASDRPTVSRALAAG